ncbi:MAG: recombinase [Oscillospiraceae bacterium]|nr:recombinase [Oscillospiraceae bacterium]
MPRATCHWLGHSQASTTLNFYSHIDATSKRNITAALENLLPLEIR